MTRRPFDPPTSALILATTSYFAMSAMSFPILPRLIDEVIGGGESAVGLAFAAFSLGLLAMRPFVAYVLDRFGRRPMVILGAAVAGLSQFLHVPAAELGLGALVAIRFLAGLGGSIMYVGLATVATELPATEHRARVFAIFSASTFVGFAIGPLIAEFVFDRSSFSAVYVVAALIGASPVLLMTLVRETRPADASPRFGGLRTMLNPIGFRLGLMTMAAVLAFMAFNAFATDWAIELGADSAKWILFTFATTSLIVRAFMGRSLDADRRLIGTIAYVLVIVASIVQAVAPGVAVLFVAAVILGLGLAVVTPLAMLIGAEAADDSERAAVVGTITFCNDVGASLGLPVLGLVAEGIGFRPMYFVVGGLTLLALIYFRSPFMAPMLDGGRRTV